MSHLDPNPDYWGEPSNHQHAKHELIRQYLNGWFPKLGSWSGRIIYLDTHAGRGKHITGNYGSPLVALHTFLNHRYKEKILERCEVIFNFIEKDQNNFDALKQEIGALGAFPKKIKIHPVCGDCFEICSGIVEHLKSTNKSMAPAFIFVDPFGFKIPLPLLHELMSFQRVELLVNVIWRELGMAIAQGNDNSGMRKSLNDIFGDDSWQKLTHLSFDYQAHACINLYREIIGSKWATYIRMQGINNATRYMLLHLTNHDAGRVLMKECMWNVCPTGGFYARYGDNPNQEYLIKSKPDLKPLREWVLDSLRQGPIRWEELSDRLKHQLWLDKHLRSVLSDLRNKSIIGNRDGTFSRKQNPELFIVE